MPATLTAADIRAELNIPDLNTSSDAELDGYLRAAQELVAEYCGPTDQGVPVTVSVAGGTAKVILPEAPVASVTSVVDRGTGLAVSGWVLNQAAGLLTLADASGYPLAFGAYLSVTYVAGRPSLPYAIRLGTLMTVEQLWRTQRGAAPLPLTGGDGLDFQSGPTPGMNALSPAVVSLLAPYKRAPRVA